MGVSYGLLLVFWNCRG